MINIIGMDLISLEHRLEVCMHVCMCVTAVFVTLKSILVVDLLGLDKLTTAYGILSLLEGVGTLAGTPLIGTFAVLYIVSCRYDTQTGVLRSVCWLSHSIQCTLKPFGARLSNLAR